VKVKRFLTNNDIVLLISQGEYSVVHTDKESKTIAYTRANLEKKGLINLKMVRRGVYAKPDSKRTAGGILVKNTEFKFSRRAAKLWLMLLFLPVFVFAQNTAPVAVPDTIKTCIDDITYFSVVRNDFDANGDKLMLNSFTDPVAGNLVSASNTGLFRYEWSPSVLNVTFNYTIRDLKFANIGSLVSNSALVTLEGATKYFYNGSYTGTNNRLTCVSRNNGAVSITGTTREANTAYQYILLEGSAGAVTISPGSGGAVEFKIK
jgi:hypothetical protein